MLQQHIAYWKEELAGAPTSLELPTDKPRPAVQSYRGATEIFELPKGLLEQLKSLGRQQEATLFMVLEATFMALLHRYTGQDDILVGTRISGRTNGEAEKRIGSFVNTVVFYARFRDDLNFRSLLQQVRERALGASAYADLPLEDLVAELAPQRDASRTPLFQVMFVFHNAGGVSQVSKVSGNRELETGTSKFDLTLYISETENGLDGLIEYSTDLFEAGTIRRMCGHYRTLLEAVTRDPDQSISALPMLTAAERQQLLVDWNKTAAVYPGKDLCLHQLIEEQAGRTPDQVALVFEGETLTYGELNRRANQLGHHLRGRGVGPEMLVGLFVERSLEMIVGILGILKAGAAYVPIDAAFPQERIAYMLKDADIKVLLTQTRLLASLPSTGAQVVCLDSFDWTSAEGPAQSDVQPHPENLAYVIYTSGSTGRPKGVCIEHRNIVNYVLGVAERLQFKPGMNHATVSTIAADLGNTVIFPALVTGGCLHVVSQERVENQSKLSDYFSRAKIDVLKIVPSHLAALQTARNPEQLMPRSRLILGGEASRLDWVERLRVLSPDCEIHNHYGPTETTVGVLTYRVGPQLPGTLSGTLPLGKPLPNSRMYILDERGQPVPIGVPGELCIGGDGVARGYLNRPDLTAEKFIPDPFRPEPGGRLYRTGDRARYLPDGNIEFCGRVDDQVKIHGYRIELGEIEGALREQGGVRDAVVLAREDESGNKQLVAYVVPKRASQPLWGSKALYVLPDGSPVVHLNKNETDYIYNEIFVLQAYLRHGITIQDGDCIVDAGANIGLFTVFASRLARNLRIISFEPNPAAFECLKANAEAWSATVKCLRLGLSRENKSAQLTFFEGFSLLSGFYADEATEREVVKTYVLNQESASPSGQLAAEINGLLDERFHARTESAQLRTLSSIIAEEGIERIDLLKINVEKSELDVLLGISPGDWPRIRQLVIEVDRRQHLEPITTLLEKHGYEVLVEQDPLLRKTELCYLYAIRPSAGHRLVRQQAADEHVRSLPPVDEEIFAPAVLRKYLQERLPPYMIPSTFVLLDKFPLTSNGKIDRKAFPAPSYVDIQPAHDFVRPRTETEKTLAAIWSEVLKVDNIGINDDFFELGGDSLLAIKAVSRIQDVFEVSMPLSTLLQAPTIASLAEILGKKHWVPSWSSLVPIRSGGSKPAVFFMHSHSSNVLEYYSLANRLESDQPVYALQARGLNGQVVKNSSVEEMVSAYLDEVRSLQPNGPYYLGGFCFGGVLALEAAQQLTAAGQEVALVVMIQSMHPDFMRFKPDITMFRRWWYRTTKRVNLELENLSYGGKGYFVQRSRRLWDRVRARTAIAFYNMSANDSIDLSRLPMYQILEALGIQHDKAYEKYAPRPYYGDVVIFRASKQLSGLMADEYLGWRGVLHGHLDVCEVPGHQQNLLAEPNVSGLARELSARLKAAQPRQRAEVAAR